MSFKCTRVQLGRESSKNYSSDVVVLFNPLSPRWCIHLCSKTMLMINSHWCCLVNIYTRVFSSGNTIDKRPSDISWKQNSVAVEIVGVGINFEPIGSLRFAQEAWHAPCIISSHLRSSPYRLRSNQETAALLMKCCTFPPAAMIYIYELSPTAVSKLLQAMSSHFLQLLDIFVFPEQMLLGWQAYRRVVGSKSKDYHSLTNIHQHLMWFPECFPSKSINLPSHPVHLHRIEWWRVILTLPVRSQEALLLSKRTNESSRFSRTVRFSFQTLLSRNFLSKPSSSSSQQYLPRPTWSALLLTPQQISPVCSDPFTYLVFLLSASDWPLMLRLLAPHDGVPHYGWGSWTRFEA